MNGARGHRFGCHRGFDGAPNFNLDCSRVEPWDRDASQETDAGRAAVIFLHWLRAAAITFVADGFYSRCRCDELARWTSRECNHNSNRRNYQTSEE